MKPSPPPVVGPILRPFHVERRIVSPAKLTNTARLESLIRGGNLYLSVQDVIALALENNVDIAIQRYGPYLAREVLRRAQGGGFLRDIGQPVNPAPTSVSLEGVNVNSVGLPEGGSGIGSGSGIVISARHSALESGPGTVRLCQPSAFHHAIEQSLFVPGSFFLLNDTRNFSGRLLRRPFLPGRMRSSLTAWHSSVLFETVLLGA